MDFIGSVLSGTSMLGIFHDVMEQFEEVQERARNKKVELKKEWQETKKMPRKMKKRRRKEIILDWQIACWGDELIF